MHPFIVAAFSLLVCTVYATPVYRGGPVEVLKREPEVHEFEKRGIKSFFENLFHPAPKCQVTKGTVKDILNHLTNKTDGPSSTIHYYDITGGFGGQSAILKKLTMPDTGKKGKKAAEKFVQTQVGQLCQTSQFLNWGVQKGKGKEGNTYYIISRKMGVSEKDSGLNEDTIKKLQKEAITRYHKSYHFDIQNPSSSNFVYRTVNGNWNAEIIDTSTVKLDKGAKLPKAPKPQSIS